MNIVSVLKKPIEQGGSKSEAKPKAEAVERGVK